MAPDQNHTEAQTRRSGSQRGLPEAPSQRQLERQGSGTRGPLIRVVSNFLGDDAAEHLRDAWPRRMMMSSGSHDLSISENLDEAVQAVHVARFCCGVLPSVSEKVRNARFIVQLQAFFVLSFEQFESNDLSFEEMYEAESAAPSTAASAALGLDQSSRGASQVVKPQQTSASLFTEAPAVRRSSSAGGSSSALMLRLQLAFEQVRRGVETAGVVARQLPAAVAAVGARGKGLSVDLDMKPTAANIARLLFLSPMHPNCMFKLLWDFLYLPVNTWICLVTPVLVVFVVNLRLTQVFGRVEFAIDLLSMLDVLIHLRTAVITSEFTARTKRAQIAWHYLRHQYGLFDMVACVPFLTVINIGPPDDFSTKVLLFRLLRLTKVLRMFNVLLTSNVHTYLRMKVFKQKGLVNLLTLLAALLVTIHHAACYFYFIGVVATGNRMYSEPQIVDYETGDTLPQSWVEAEGLISYKAVSKYIVSLYWAMYTFLTVGYGDVAIVNTAEKIWAIVCAITGIIMVGWFMGAVAAYMGGTGGFEAEMQQRRQDVYQFVVKRRVHGHLASRVKQYEGSLMWRELTGRDREVIKGLPRHLRTQVVLHVFREVVRGVPFLQSRPQQFVAELLMRLRPRLFENGDYIARQGEIGDEVYFLACGEALVVREAPPEHRKAPPPPDEMRGGGGGADRDTGLTVIASALSRNFSRIASAVRAHPLGRLSFTGSLAPAGAAAPAAAARAGAGGAGATEHPEPGCEPPPPPRGLDRAADGSEESLLVRLLKATPPLPPLAAPPPHGSAHAAAAAGAAAGAAAAGGGEKPSQHRGRDRRTSLGGERGGAAGGCRTLLRITAGGPIGYVSCVSGQPRRNSVVAVTPSSKRLVQVLVLSRQEAEELNQRWPGVFDHPTAAPGCDPRRSSLCLDEEPDLAAYDRRDPLAGGGGGGGLQKHWLTADAGSRHPPPPGEQQPPPPPGPQLEHPRQHPLLEQPDGPMGAPPQTAARDTLWRPNGARGGDPSAATGPPPGPGPGCGGDGGPADELSRDDVHIRAYQAVSPAAAACASAVAAVPATAAGPSAAPRSEPAGGATRGSHSPAASGADQPAGPAGGGVAARPADRGPADGTSGGRVEIELQAAAVAPGAAGVAPTIDISPYPDPHGGPQQRGTRGANGPPGTRR